LNLTTRPLAVKGGESGPALRPGRAAESLLFSKIASKMMPPKKPLSAEEVAVLRRWIDDGAAWEGTVARVRKPVTGGPERAGPGLVVRAAGTPSAPSGGQAQAVAVHSDRCLRAGRPRSKGANSRPARRPLHSAAPHHLRPDRPAAVTR